MRRLQNHLFKPWRVLILFGALVMGCGGGREKPERSASSAKIAEQVGDIAIVRLEAPAFANLTPDQQRAAYYLSQAVLAGRDIPCNQINSRSAEIRTFLENIRLNATYAAPDYYVKPFENYLKSVWIHGGFYDLTTGGKLPPQIGERELGQLMFLALANSGGQLASLLDINLKYAYIIDTLFNPSLDSTILHPADAAFHDLHLDFPQGFYGGVTTAEALAFQAKYPFNSRLMKRADGLREMVYRTGDDELASGLFAAELERVIGNLEKARPYLPPNRIPAVDLLIEHLRSGRPSAFDSAAVLWRRSSAPLDFILGFADPRFDPLGHKGLWTGLLFLPDDVARARLDRLQGAAGDLLAGLPEGLTPSLRRSQLKAAQLLTSIGANGPRCPDVYRDPPHAKTDFPQQSIIFTNVLAARARAESALEFYASRADSARAVQFAGEIAFAEAALREVFDLNNEGTGSARNDLPTTPLEIVAAIQRELILLRMIHDPKLIQLGLLFDNVAQDEAFQHFARRYLGELSEPESDQGQRARRVIGSYLTTAGVMKLENIGGRYLCQVVDGNLMHSRISELLEQIQQVTNAPAPQRAAADFMARYSPPHEAMSRPTEIAGHIQRAERAQEIKRIAFILPLVEADFNPMGGIESVHLGQPASFAEEMFLFGGHEPKKEKR